MILIDLQTWLVILDHGIKCDMYEDIYYNRHEFYISYVVHLSLRLHFPTHVLLLYKLEDF